MDIGPKIRNFFARLQNLPEQGKKAVLWTIVIVIGIIMGIFWVQEAVNNFSKIGNEVKNIEIPKITVPNITSSDNPKIANLINDGSVVNEADWKTYKNTKYGFEIKYPLDWTYRDYNSGAAFFPENKTSDNITGNGAISVGFYSRGTSYCKIPFEDYVKIAGPSEIQNYESLNTAGGGINNNGLERYIEQWNYTDFQGVGKISLPITYFETKPELCGDIEIFLNDNNYSDIYGNIISNFNIK